MTAKKFRVITREMTRTPKKPAGPPPNRLAEWMHKQHIDDPSLAAAVDTNKQQIWKLRTGKARLTARWAERLAPHIGVDWPLLMNPATPEARAFAPTRADVDVGILGKIGRRIVWGRTYRGYTRAVAAERFDIPVNRLAALEAGAETMTIYEAITITTKLQLTTDFLLRGQIGSLPFDVGEDYRTDHPSLSAHQQDTA